MSAQPGCTCSICETDDDRGNSQQLNQSDRSLRDRIAAAIARADAQPSTDCDPYSEMADAVMAELVRVFVNHQEWKADDE